MSILGISIVSTEVPFCDHLHIGELILIFNILHQEIK